MGPQEAPKPYYPGFRDMNLLGAFGLTLLFFVVIWFVVVSSRLLGLRKRIQELQSTLATAEDVLRAAIDKSVAGAAFITPALRNGDLPTLIAALAKADDAETKQAAVFLAEANRAKEELADQLIRSMREYHGLLEGGPSKMVARILKLGPMPNAE